MNDYPHQPSLIRKLSAAAVLGIASLAILTFAGMSHLQAEDGHKDASADPSAVSPASTLPKIGFIRGKVTSDGKPVAYAVITLEQQDGWLSADGCTNEKGEYAFSIASGTWKASVAVRGFHSLSESEPIRVSSGGETTRDFVLQRSRSRIASQGQGIKGTVVLSRGIGRQLPGTPPHIEVEVVALPEKKAIRQVLPPKPMGRYQRDLPEGGYRVVAQAEGYREVSSPVCYVVPDRYTTVNLVLAPSKVEPTSVVLQVTVIDRLTRELLPETTLRCWQSDDSESVASTTITDSHGQALVKTTAGGKYTIEAKCEGYQDRQITVESVPGKTRVQIALATVAPPLTALEVMVIDAETRKPLSDVALNFRRQGQPAEYGLRVATDATGRKVLDAKEPGRHTLEARCKEYQPWVSTEDLKPGRNRLEVALKPFTPPATDLITELWLQIVEKGRTGIRPIAGAQIEVHRNMKQVATRWSESGGTYTTTLPSGVYEFHVSRDGYLPSSRSLELKGKLTSETIFLMSRPSNTYRLNVRVLAAPGKKPLPSATVTASANNKEIARGTSGSDGICRLLLPRNGEFLVRATKAGFDTGTTRVYMTRDSLTSEILLYATTPTLHQLELHVVDPQKRPVLGASIEIFREGKMAARGRSDAKGLLSTQLPTGLYVVRATVGEKERGQTSFTLEANTRRVVVVQFTLPSAAMTLNLLVINRQQKPISGAQVVVLQRGRVVARGKSMANGRVLVESLKASEYDVTVSRTGYKSAKLSFSPASSGQRTVILERVTDGDFRSPVLEVAVRLLHPDGKRTMPLSGATVEVYRGKVQLKPLTRRKRKPTATGKTDQFGICQPGFPLSPGTYTIRASKKGYIGKTLTTVMGSQGKKKILVLEPPSVK